MDLDNFSNLSFHCPRKAPNEIWVTLAQSLQRRSHLKFSTFSPYKCMVPIQMHIGKQTWPHRKKVKCQCTTFILATLADLPSLLICAKIQPQGILGSGEDFYYIWVWQPSWSMDCNHFSNLSFPQPKEAPYEIWAKLAQQLQRRSR